MSSTRNGRCFVYLLKEPDTGEVRYVGITKNPLRRYQQHIERQRHRTGVLVGNWILDLQQSGKAPKMQVLTAFPTREKACIMEAQVIAEFKKLGYRLVNGSEGGEW